MKLFSTAAPGQTASGTLMPPAAAKTNAQKLSLSFKNGSLEKLFTEIGKKTSYVFFYDVAILNGT